MPSLIPALVELERALPALAQRFPDPALLLDQSPVLVIQSGRLGRRRVYGWTAPRCWRQPGSDLAYTELSLSAEDLARPRLELLVTLLHELVHVYNLLICVRDCSEEQYHYVAFRNLATVVGLKVRAVDRHLGWAHTDPSPELAADLAALPLNDEAFALYREASVPRPRPSRVHKWTCGCTIVRCAVALLASCDQCGRPFQRAAAGRVARLASPAQGSQEPGGATPPGPQDHASGL
jgi:hypothetical protein